MPQREHSEIGWFTLDELATMPLAPADKAFSQWLAEFIRTKSATGPQP